MADEPEEDEERRMTRRSALKIGVAAAGGAAVGGLAGFFAGGASRQPAIDQLNTQLAAITKLANLPPVSGEISMYNWSQYTNYALLDQFVERYGVQLVYDEGAQTQENFREELLLNNPKGRDIMVITDYLVEEMIALGKLERLNKDYIPNMDYLDDQEYQTPWDPRHDYSLPYLAGTTGIGWNQNRVRFPTGQTQINSWDQLFDPSPGGFLRLNSGPPTRVTLNDDRDEVLGAVAIYLGKSVNDLSPSTLNEIEQTLLAMKPYAQYADADTYYNGLLDETFHVSHAWSGDVMFVREEGAKPEITYTVPDEGAHVWTDNFVVPRNAPHKDTAMVFINYMWEAANQAVLAMFRNYIATNRAARRGGALDFTKNDGSPLGMIIPYVRGLPDIDVLTDPVRAPLLQVTKPRTPEQNRTLDELWLRVR